MVNFEKPPSPSLFEQAKSLAGEQARSVPGLVRLLKNHPGSSLAVLPQASNGGYLPYWLAFVSVVSVFNTVQTFVSPTLTKRIYSKKPEEGEYPDHGLSYNRPLILLCAIVTGVGRRTFGVWTLLAAVIRFYAAYEINNRA